MEEKLKALCDKITKETQEDLTRCHLGCEANLHNAIAHYTIGNKYTKVDIGSSGKYMVDKEGNIWGIKAYGQIHKGHNYGTLDTINDYFWGDYTARKIN